ncbi:MAG: hypothetical protein QM757_47140 [Paludibaculum sp.]
MILASSGSFARAALPAAQNCIEIGGILLRGLDGLRLERGRRQPAVRLSVLLHRGDAPQESRLVHRPAVHGQALARNRRRLVDLGRHHLRPDPVSHLHSAQGVAVLHGSNLELHRLAGLIPPFGMVGGDPNLNRADPVVGGQRQGEKGEKR